MSGSAAARLLLGLLSCVTVGCQSCEVVEAELRQQTWRAEALELQVAAQAAEITRLRALLSAPSAVGADGRPHLPSHDFVPAAYWHAAPAADSLSEGTVTPSALQTRQRVAKGRPGLGTPTPVRPAHR